MRTRLSKGCLLDFARWNAFFQKISICPEGTFVSTTQPVVLVIAHHPWNFHDFPTWLGNPWKEYFCQKSWCTILLCHLLPLVYCRLLDPSPLRISFLLRWRVCIFSGTTQSWGLQVNRMLPQYYEGFALAIIHSKRWDCRVVTKLIFCLIFPPVITMFWVFLVVL